VNRTRPLQNCDDRYKIATTVTKLLRPLQNYRDVTVKHNAEIPGDTKVLAFLHIVHTPAGLFTPNFGRILDDCVFQGPQGRYTQQMSLIREWEVTASVRLFRVGPSKTFFHENVRYTQTVRYIDHERRYKNVLPRKQTAGRHSLRVPSCVILSHPESS